VWGGWFSIQIFSLEYSGFTDLTDFFVPRFCGNHKSVYTGKKLYLIAEYSGFTDLTDFFVPRFCGNHKSVYTGKKLYLA